MLNKQGERKQNRRSWRWSIISFIKL